jgi:hypothetical protein
MTQTARTLADVLQGEHREIDDGINAFVAVRTSARRNRYAERSRRCADTSMSRKNGSSRGCASRDCSPRCW